MIQKAGVLDTQARLLEELFRAMLEELMSGRLPVGELVEKPGLSWPGGQTCPSQPSASGQVSEPARR